MKPRMELVIAVFLGAALLLPAPARAHCDALDGPVVKAAQRALDSGEINGVLIWVAAADEPEIREAYQRTRAVRRLGGDAQALADRYFFETLVRVHRKSEGAPYTGLKPAGQDLGPAIPAADRALETRNVAALASLLGDAVDRGVRERFRAALAARDFAPGDVAAGREYVHAYTALLEYVEHLYEMAAEK